MFTYLTYELTFSFESYVVFCLRADQNDSLQTVAGAMIDGHVDRLRVLTSTNTQTRRLGYLVAICQLLNSGYVPPTQFQDDVENWAGENRQALKEHVSDRGEIRHSARSLGFQRYVELAHDLQLLTSVSGYIRLAKVGRVLVIADEDSHPANTPFMLSDETSALLLYQLLLLDADYSLPTLELANRYHRQSDLLNSAQEHLLRRFRVMEARTGSTSARIDVHDRALAIERWTKPVKYLEHILLPRLHWLLDLRLLSWEAFLTHREFVLSEKGHRLLEKVPKFEGHHMVDRTWCQNELFTAQFGDFRPSSTVWDQVPEADQLSLIMEYVQIGSPLFRTMRYPRVPAYQLVLFTALRLLCDENIVAGFEDIKRALDKYSRSNWAQWTFFWSDYDDDGYLLLSQ